MVCTPIQLDSFETWLRESSISDELTCLHGSRSITAATAALLVRRLATLELRYSGDFLRIVQLIQVVT